MRGRRLARRLALDVLYEAEIKDVLPLDAYDAHVGEGWGPDGDASGEPSEDVRSYARALVEGVQAHHADIDALIASYADRWAIKRMPVVDRNLLRLSIFELLWGEGVPVAVAINEAVELAKELSTEDSGRFVNGLLGHVAADRRLAR